MAILYFEYPDLDVSDQVDCCMLRSTGWQTWGQEITRFNAGIWTLCRGTTIISSAFGTPDRARSIVRRSVVLTDDGELVVVKLCGRCHLEFASTHLVN